MGFVALAAWAWAFAKYGVLQPPTDKTALGLLAASGAFLFIYVHANYFGANVKSSQDTGYRIGGRVVTRETWRYAPGVDAMTTYRWCVYWGFLLVFLTSVYVGLAIFHVVTWVAPWSQWTDLKEVLRWQ
jgi:hypothetical protein